MSQKPLMRLLASQGVVCLLVGLLISPVFGCEKPRESHAASEPSSAAATQVYRVPRPVRTALSAYQSAIQVWTRQQRHRDSGMGLVEQFHGTLYEYFRNDALDAIPHEVHQGGGHASSLRRNQYGLTLTGPLPFGPVRNRNTHVSLSYEGTRESIDRAFLGTVPTLQERLGNFSDLVDSSGNPLTIYNPATTRPNPAYDPAQPVSLANLQYLRDSFSGNVIPAGQLDPVALKILNLYPAPNTHVGPYLTNNYFATAAERNTADGAILHLDHSFSARNHFGFEGADSVGLHQLPSVFANDASPGGSTLAFLSRHGSLSDTWNLSDGTVNQFSAVWAADQTRSVNAVTQNWPQALGLTGLSSSAFPIIDLNYSYTSLGHGNPNVEEDWRHLNLDDHLSTRRDKHMLSFGVRYRLAQLHSFEAGAPSGNFFISGLQTSLPGINNTGSPLAQFLLGDVSSMQASVVPGPMDYRQSKMLFDVQDRYPIRPGFDWTMGMTVKVTTPRQERLRRQSSFDPSVTNPADGLAGAMVFQNRPGMNGLQPTRTVFEPHAGFTLNPFHHSRTVIRGGYHLFYQDFPMVGEHFGSLGYNLQPQFTSANDQLSPAFQLQNGVPQNYPPPPDLSSTVANGQFTQFLSPSGTLPVNQNWDFQIEQQLSPSVIARLHYTGALATHQYVWNGIDLNGLPPSALQYGNQLYDQAFNQSLRPFPQYTGIGLGGAYPWGTATNEAVSATLEDRFTAGLMFQATWQFSKGLDNYSGPMGPQDNANLASDKAITAFNRSQVLSVNFLYQLPVGQDGSWLNGAGPLTWLLSDWSVNGFVTLQNGFPLVLWPMFNNTGGVADSLRVNTVAGVNPTVSNPSADLWFNPAAFAQPADFTFGNYSRSSPNLRAPGDRLADLSLNRDISLTETRTVQLFLEAFNAFNHANLNTPDTVIGPASSPNLHAGKITGSTGGRVVQMGLRFAF